MNKIILASASPRRKELLAQIGLKFEIDPANGEEEIIEGIEPHQLVKNISLEKAKSVAAKHVDAIIIAADTIGVLNGKILCKPHTIEEARKILSLINGKAHTVITGFTIIDTGTNKTLSKSVETLVYIKQLTSAEIDAYVKTGEPMDKAGAYGIQGRGALIVERIEGDYYTVVGLPLFALAETLKEFGITVFSSLLF